MRTLLSAGFVVVVEGTVGVATAWLMPFMLVPAVAVAAVSASWWTRGWGTDTRSLAWTVGVANGLILGAGWFLGSWTDPELMGYGLGVRSALAAAIGVGWGAGFLGLTLVGRSIEGRGEHP